MASATQAAGEAQLYLHVAAPASLEVPSVLARQRRRGPAVRRATAQVDMRDGLEATAGGRLETGQVDALGPRKLPQDCIACRFFQPPLHGTRLQAGEPVGQLRVDAQRHPGEVAVLGMERVFTEERNDSGDVLASFEEAPAERLDHYIAARVEAEAGR